MNAPLIVDKAQLRAALFAWCIQARTGETASYQETAAFSADEVADSGVEHLYALLVDSGATVQGQLDLLPPEDTLEAEFNPLSAQGAEFLAIEDIGAGQWVTFNADGQIVGLKTEPKAKITLVENVSAGFFDA